MKRRSVLAFTAAGAVTMAAGCTSSSSSSATSSSSSASSSSASLGAWSYDATNDVYYQIGLSYVTKPAAKDYETLAVFVPGAYFQGTKNGDGTYAATVNASGTAGGYRASTAPIVFPVNTPGYAAQKPLTAYSYSDISSYVKAGFVYVHAGMRGKDSNTDAYTGNAPWGVTDLKAAVRYVRHHASVIPGSKDRIFVFGMSGGGAQSAIMGTSGDSKLYTPYLESLGAAMEVSDAVAGAMCWCPITNLDYANAAYEWNMGQFASSDTRAAGTWTKQYSTDLATAFASYQNRLGLKDASGERLTLERSGTGVYLAGTYYDHLVSVINASLNNFLKDTKFPYTPSSMGGGPPAGGGVPGGAGMPSGGAAPGGQSQSSTTYKTVKEYIAHLNSGGTWVTYDAATNTAKVTSLEGFAQSQKTASKSVGAFDGPDRGATENVVLGSGTSGLHFAAVSEQVIEANQTAYAKLSGWKSAYAAGEYTSDFKKTDTVGRDVIVRGNMYNPLYFLNASYAGYRSAKVAPNWRIRTGIMQGDTANTTEVNLALALAGYGIENVDFATVWGQGHTMAERTGDATANFISWVKQVA